MSALAFLNCYYKAVGSAHLDLAGGRKTFFFLSFLPFSIHDYIIKFLRAIFLICLVVYISKIYLSFPLPLSPQRDQVVLVCWYNSDLKPDISYINAHRNYQIC